MAESKSLAQRASLLAVNLVNPRFTNFNKPLCLAVTVGILSLICFGMVLGYYMAEEVVIVTDGSSEGTNLVSGPQNELRTILREYTKLPQRCTLGGDSKFFQGNGRNVSEDGLTAVEYSCDYQACIYSSYNLVGDSTRVSINAGPGLGEIDPKKILDHMSWQSCFIPDEWTQGLVTESFILDLYAVSDVSSLPGCKIVALDPSAPEQFTEKHTWCPLDQEKQALLWFQQCCDVLRKTSALPSDCKRDGFYEYLCFDWLPDMTDHLQALTAQTQPSLYPLCPDGHLVEEAEGATRTVGRSNFPNCSLQSLINTVSSGSQATSPVSFKIHWAKKEIKTTRARPTTLTALSSALALTTYIEMAVTVVVILILRQLGYVKEIKKFTWGEIMNEQRDPQVEQKEMEERMEANIIMTLESGKDPMKKERESLRQHKQLLGRASATE